LPGFRIRCIGTAPLLMHNGRLIDPIDTIVKQIKEVSGKARKTDEDHLQMAQLEWLGGLYHHPDLGPFVPGANLYKTLVEGARMAKNGKKIERGVFLEAEMIPLEYDGPRDHESLWQDSRFRSRVPVRVAQSRVMRTRPRFPQWQLEAHGQFDNEVLNLDDLARAAQAAGAMIGVCDWRPTYGRFRATVDATADEVLV
jgi:hypothetical protein